MGTAITGKNHPFEEQLGSPEANLGSDSMKKNASESPAAATVANWTQKFSEGYGMAVDRVKSTAQSMESQVERHPLIATGVAAVVGGVIGYMLACRRRD